jgi:hypothetical protein
MVENGEAEHTLREKGASLYSHRVSSNSNGDGIICQRQNRMDF